MKTSRLLLPALGISLLSLLLNACSDPPPAAPRLERGDFGETARLTLERTSCYGACPVYALSVSGDGKVEYEGTAHVRVVGHAEKVLSEAELTRLVEALNEAEYLGLQDEYLNYEVTDHQTVNSSVEAGGVKKSIRHYLGDRSAPPSLAALENKIDEIVGTAGWIK